MPGHSLNRERTACTACGLSSLDIARSGTMECSGVVQVRLAPTGLTPEQAVARAVGERYRLNPGKLTEAEFQDQVIGLAELNGWRVYHTHDSRRSRKGFPDLVMVKTAGIPRLVMAELKVPPNVPTPEQEAWLDDLYEVDRRSCCERDRYNLPPPAFQACLWTPDDWEQIVRILSW